MSLGSTADKPGIRKSLVVVTVTGVSRMTEISLSSALSLSGEVVAVSVQFDKERAAALQSEWEHWDPGVDLVILQAATHSIAAPMLSFLGAPEIQAHGQVLVLIPEIEPRKWRHRLLQNQRDVILANVLRRHTDVIVARVPFRLHQD